MHVTTEALLRTLKKHTKPGDPIVSLVAPVKALLAGGADGGQVKQALLAAHAVQAIQLRPEGGFGRLTPCEEKLLPRGAGGTVLSYAQILREPMKEGATMATKKVSKKSARKARVTHKVTTVTKKVAKKVAKKAPVKQRKPPAPKPVPASGPLFADAKQRAIVYVRYSITKLSYTDRVFLASAGSGAAWLETVLSRFFSQDRSHEYSPAAVRAIKKAVISAAKPGLLQLIRGTQAVQLKLGGQKS